jgi:heme O synthase-like polyprenyltransferase
LKRLNHYLNLIRWDRPAGWLLLLWPSLSALWIAADGFPGWHLVLVFVLGTVLMRSAGCCVNDVADRDFDRHVKRTAQRRSGAVATDYIIAANLFNAVARTHVERYPVRVLPQAREVRAEHDLDARQTRHDPAQLLLNGRLQEHL